MVVLIISTHTSSLLGRLCLGFARTLSQDVRNAVAPPPPFSTSVVKASVSAGRVATCTSGSSAKHFVKRVELSGGAGGLSSEQRGEKTRDAHSALAAVWAQPQYYPALHHHTLYSSHT